VGDEQQTAGGTQAAADVAGIAAAPAMEAGGFNYMGVAGLAVGGLPCSTTHGMP
jgi:hypothetical protein